MRPRKRQSVEIILLTAFSFAQKLKFLYILYKIIQYVITPVAGHLLPKKLIKFYKNILVKIGKIVFDEYTVLIKHPDRYPLNTLTA